MSDVTCSHCAEPWEVDYLRHDSIGSWEPDQAGDLDPLGPVEPTVGYLVSRGEKEAPVLVQRIGDDPFAARFGGRPLTVAELFDYWNNNLDAELADPLMKAAKHIVETAVYRAVLSGQGCPSCGFNHDRPGEHRETTLKQLVHGGVTDDDPAIFMTADR